MNPIVYLCVLVLIGVATSSPIKRRTFNPYYKRSLDFESEDENEDEDAFDNDLDMETDKRKKREIFDFEEEARELTKRQDIEEEPSNFVLDSKDFSKRQDEDDTQDFESRDLTKRQDLDEVEVQDFNEADFDNEFESLDDDADSGDLDFESAKEFTKRQDEWK